MSLLSNLQLLSQYNQWMNQKHYQTAQKLGNKVIQQNQGAFFDSILNTLNHIYIADIIWLRRFSQHPHKYLSLNQLPELPNYQALGQIVANEIETLATLRQELDQTIILWCQEIESPDLEQQLSYSDTKGNPHTKNFGQLIQHFFNHQTHHRGQVSTLMYQQGVDIGVTDLLKFIPKQSKQSKQSPNNPNNLNHCFGGENTFYLVDFLQLIGQPPIAL